MTAMPHVLSRLFVGGFLAICFASANTSFAQTGRVFHDDEFHFSFRYPSNWEPVEPQRKSTRVLLYARDGSEATANISVVKSDKHSVRDFDVTYFQTIISKINRQSKVSSVRYISVLGKEMAIADATFKVEMPSRVFDGKSVVMATIYNGNRFMLIVNGLPEKFKGPSEAFDLMVGTFSFQ